MRLQRLETRGPKKHGGPEYNELRNGRVGMLDLEPDRKNASVSAQTPNVTPRKKILATKTRQPQLRARGRKRGKWPSGIERVEPHPTCLRDCCAHTRVSPNHSPYSALHFACRFHSASSTSLQSRKVRLRWASQSAHT